MTLTVTISDIGSARFDMDAKLTGADQSYTGYRYLRFWIYEADTGRSTTWEFKSSASGGSSSAWSEVITTCGDYDLQPNTEYMWAARVGEVEDGEIQWRDEPTDSGTVVTASAGSNAPALWDWEANVQRQEYYDILRGESPAVELDAHGEVVQSYLLSSVWNDMCSKVASMRVWRGYSWDSSVLPLSETRMTTDSKELTADRLNALLLNVDEVIYTGLHTVHHGDTVRGQDQIIIMEKCNQAIEEG